MEGEWVSLKQKKQGIVLVLTQEDSKFPCVQMLKAPSSHILSPLRGEGEEKTFCTNAV